MSTRRERRRTDAVREIKCAAWRQLAHSGPAELSLRGIARDVGVAVQSLYHYFPSREALVNALAADATEALAAAVETAEGPSGLRSWACANRAAFLLLSATPRTDGPGLLDEVLDRDAYCLAHGRVLMELLGHLPARGNA